MNQPLLDPKKCIAAGGRRRCMDCRCNLESPPHTVQETWADYGYHGDTRSGHGKREETK